MWQCVGESATLNHLNGLYRMGTLEKARFILADPSHPLF